MKCPSCGEVSKNGTVVCPKCGRYCGRTFASKNEEVFSSRYRTPYNGGYTQQAQPKAENDKLTQNGTTDASQNDDMFFSTERKQYWGKDIKKNGTAEHIAESNPYDSSVYKEQEKPSPAKEVHTTEFVAENIVQFRKHRFARDLANLTDLHILGLFAATLIGIVFDLIIDTSRKTAPIVLVYTFFLIIFSLIAKKTYRKFATISIAVLTIIYTVVMMISVIKVHSVKYAAEIIFVYLPIAAQDIMCARLTVLMSRYHDHWEAYKLRGIYVNEDNIEKEYEIYKNKENAD